MIVGGGLGRTPMIGKVIRDFLPRADLLPYCEAIVSVYNLLGRRDNKYKARIKITVHENGIDKIRDLVEDRVRRTPRPRFGGVDQELLAAIEAHFAPPPFGRRARRRSALRARPMTPTRCSAPGPTPTSPPTAPGLCHRHRLAQGARRDAGRCHGGPDARLADLAERYGHDELRISHEQNVILPHVHKAYLPALHAALKEVALATANVGLVSDIIACPGMDYCALATARSIPVAQEIATRFDELKLEHDVGALKIKISGCINACGHHHVGHIGILGLDRAGVENYQITLGGDGTETAAIGERTGPGFAYDEIVPAIERLIAAYLDLRDDPDETFLRPIAASGMAPFKAALYPEAKEAPRCRLKPPFPRSGRTRARSERALPPPFGDHPCSNARWPTPRSGGSRWCRPSARNRWCCCTWSRSWTAHAGAVPRHPDAVPRNAGLSARGGRAPGPDRCAGHPRRGTRNLARRDPDGTLHRSDPDACCALRKTEPL